MKQREGGIYPETNGSGAKAALFLAAIIGIVLPILAVLLLLEHLFS